MASHAETTSLTTQSETESGKPLGPTMTILQATVQGGRRRGQQKKRWENHISEWAGLRFCNALREAEKKKSNGEKGLLCPWYPNDQHDYAIGARCKDLHEKLRVTKPI